MLSICLSKQTWLCFFQKSTVIIVIIIFKKKRNQILTTDELKKSDVIHEWDSCLKGILRADSHIKKKKNGWLDSQELAFFLYVLQ